MVSVTSAVIGMASRMAAAQGGFLALRMRAAADAPRGDDLPPLQPCDESTLLSEAGFGHVVHCVHSMHEFVLRACRLRLSIVGVCGTCCVCSMRALPA